MSRRSFDAVLTLGWHLKSLQQGIIAAKFAGLPVLIRGDSQLGTPRSAVKKAAKQLFYPALLKAFDAALFVGERNRRYYAHYGYPEDRLFRSPHCIDTCYFVARATIAERERRRSLLGVSAETRLVLFAGKLVPFKRPIDVIDAVAKLRATGCPAEALVAGSGELEDAVRTRARDLSVPLHLLGFQNQSQMPSAYAAADALVLPSDGRETWGLVCNEAIASGLPLLTSEAVGCAADLAADGYVGRTFPLGDTTACAKALRALFATPPPISAIHRLSESYSISAAADGVMQALEFLQRRRDR